MADGGMGPSEFEREIERLPEVRAARVVASPAGRILEIHLVSDGSKAPKQLTRDVETVAATQGLDIDRRTISIAQMPEGSEPASSQAFGLSSISVGVEGAQATCRVRVARAESDGIGEGSAPATSSGRPRLIAASTLDAVSSLLGSRLPADCDNALIVDIGAHRVAVVVLVFVGDGGAQDVVAGVHPVRGDPDEAIARAVLDAVNRRHVV
jgi:hypothetical protein